MYTCPMHPEMQQQTPGKCPKCGMQLVLKDGVSKVTHVSDDRGLGMLTWKNYIPLIVIIGLIFIASAAVSLAEYRNGAFNIAHFVTYFMTGFFMVFAGFKLIDLKGFADGYSTYDLLAQRWFQYGYIYPFLELSFALAMLSGFMPPALLWAEFAVMLFSGIGVAIKLAKGDEFQCACLGTFLKVPLTKVTLIEDFGMALLALALIFLQVIK